VDHSFGMISDEWCLNYLFPLLISRARFIPLWKRNALWELVNETMPSLVWENEKLFVYGVPFQFVGLAKCLLFHLLNEDFEWELCFIQHGINYKLWDKFALSAKLKLSWAYLPYVQLKNRLYCLITEFNVVCLKCNVNCVK